MRSIISIPLTMLLMALAAPSVAGAANVENCEPELASALPLPHPISSMWNLRVGNHPSFEAVAFIHTTSATPYFRPDELAEDLAMAFAVESSSQGKRYIHEMTTNGFLISERSATDARLRNLRRTEEGHKIYLNFLKAQNVSEENVRKYVSFWLGQWPKYRSKAPPDIALFVLGQVTANASGIQLNKINASLIDTTEMSLMTINRWMRTLKSEGFLVAGRDAKDPRKKIFRASEKGLRLIREYKEESPKAPSDQDLGYTYR